MKRAIIICEIIKEDIENLLKNIPYDLDIFYLEAKLHSNPGNLKIQLQAKIDELYDYDEILLTYGLCGNGLLGIKATNSKISFPKVDDCICAMMNCHCDYNDFRKESYFISRGWLSVGDTFNQELKHMKAKYNDKTIKMILKSMYGNYKSLIYMQNEDELSSVNISKAEEMSKATELELIYKKASLNYYEDLLSIVHSDKIVVIEKGDVIKINDFYEVK